MKMTTKFELRDLDEGEDDDVMHVDDLEKARVKQEAEEKQAEQVSEVVQED